MANISSMSFTQTNTNTLNVYNLINKINADTELNKIQNDSIKHAVANTLDLVEIQHTNETKQNVTRYKERNPDDFDIMNGI